MAKKKYDYRAQQAHKRNQQKIADAKAKQKQKEFIEKYGKQVLIGVVAVVLVIAAIWMFGGLIRTDGSLPIMFGKLQNVEEDWIIANLNTTDKPRYYKMAEYTAPEGYTLSDEDDLFSDERVQTQTYVANDENAVVQEMFVSGVRNITAENQVNTVLGYYTTKSEAKRATIAGYDVHYGYISYETTPVTYDDQGIVVDVPEEEKTGRSGLCMYIDGIKDSCVLVMLYGKNGPLAEVTTMEALEAEMEKFLTPLVVEK
ncbi:MAG: hypothetical protein E7316_00860 [Clostridiales bacterium]|nr:hypothetical protein [Clostridiales bacterium]